MDQALEPALALDEASDVLYLRLPGRSLYSSSQLPSDSFLIVNRDATGEVVGLQALYASDLVHAWSEHPDRHLLPPSFAAAIDTWASSQRR